MPDGKILFDRNFVIRCSFSGQLYRILELRRSFILYLSSVILMILSSGMQIAF